MHLDGNPRGPRLGAKRLDAELDALVAREVDALSGRRPLRARRQDADADRHLEKESETPPAEADAQAADDPDLAGEDPSRSAAPIPAESNVVGLRRRGSRNEGESDIPFSAEEEAFIESAVAFLQSRQHADAIIEEVWSHAILTREGNDEEALEDEMFVDDTSYVPDEEPDGAPRPARKNIPEARTGDSVTPIHAGRPRGVVPVTKPETPARSPDEPRPPDRSAAPSEPDEHDP